MPALRLFVATPVPPTIEEEIVGILHKASKHTEVRWVSKDQLHITLRFLGETDELLVPKLIEQLDHAISLLEPFDAELGGVGAFPNLNRARTLFIPLIHGEENFDKWEKVISGLLEKMGVKPEGREYHPHLTLGRVREGKDGHQAIQALQGICPTRWNPWKVDRFILFKSQLHPEGPVYTRLKEFGVQKG